MSLSQDEVLHIASLARIGLGEDEVVKFQLQLSDILGHFEMLSELDTAGVEPTAYPLPLESVMRDDDVRPSMPLDDALANAPATEDGAFRVRAVLDE